MGTDKPPDSPAHVEPVPIVEEFVSGLGFFQVVDDVTFLVFYVDQVLPPEFGDHRRERRIMRKLIMTNTARDRMRRMLEAVDDPIDTSAITLAPSGEVH